MCSVLVLGTLVATAWLANGEGLMATWDGKAAAGDLSNGLVALTMRGAEVNVGFADGRVALQGLHYYGWLSDSPVRPASPDDAAAKGLPRLSTQDFSQLTGRVVNADAQEAILELQKQAAGKAAGMAYRERFVVHASSRRAEQAKVPVIIQCSGPGGGVYSEIYENWYGRLR